VKKFTYSFTGFQNTPAALPWPWLSSGFIAIKSLTHLYADEDLFLRFFLKK